MRIRLIAPVAAVAFAMLLTGCDDDEGGSGLGGGGPELPDFDAGDLDLETTGGFGGPDEDAPADGPADGPPQIEGNEDWYARWESNGIVLYTTTTGVLYTNAQSGEVCRQQAGIAGGLDWEPVLFTCEQIGTKHVNLRLSGDTVTLEWDAGHESLQKVESLAGQSVDLNALP
ncbi:hypothetical protein [Streptomyces sp. NBRC 109706]|uniref:hypothetical protein n=1 Tax=Streptomyces sp. NBRC 109706 TaxID=1550035 RepID=UPI00078070A3|nr:hypothetical protein [Streptomyces sp. NBRC 109706]